AGGPRRARAPRADAAAGPRRAPLRGAARGDRRSRGARAGDHGGGAAAPGPGRRRRAGGPGLGGGMTRKFMLVGLTGGVATRHSTVAEVFRSPGVRITEAALVE